MDGTSETSAVGSPQISRKLPISVKNVSSKVAGCPATWFASWSWGGSSMGNTGLNSWYAGSLSFVSDWELKAGGSPGPWSSSLSERLVTEYRREKDCLHYKKTNDLDCAVKLPWFLLWCCSCSSSLIISGSLKHRWSKLNLIKRNFMLSSQTHRTQRKVK